MKRLLLWFVVGFPSLLMAQDLVIGGSDITDVTVGTLKKTGGNDRVKDIIASAWTSSGVNYTERTYLKLPTDSVDKTKDIDSAILLLYGSPNPANPQLSTGDNVFHIERVVEPWSKGTINWNNQPRYVDSSGLTLGPTVSKRQNMRIDMTQMIKHQIDKPWVSHGYVVRLKTEAKYRTILFCSSNYPVDSLRPKLLIYYKSDTNTAPVIPRVSIKDIRTQVDISGVSKYHNQRVSVVGVVNHSINLMAKPGLQISIQDGGWGLSVIGDGKDYGYTPTVGDSLVLWGTIGNRNGLTLIDSITKIKYKGSVTINTAKLVTKLDEQTESMPISLNNFWVVDTTIWGSSMNTVNTLVTNGFDTVYMVVNEHTNLSSISAPSVRFNVTGIGDQNDSTAPFDGYYGIIPLRKAAIEPLEKRMSLKQLNKKDSRGDLKNEYTAIITRGVVNTDVAFEEASAVKTFIQDERWGITVLDSLFTLGLDTLKNGDSIEVRGRLFHKNGQPVISKVLSIEKISTVMKPQIENVNALEEGYEAKLVRLSGFRLLDSTKWQSSGTFYVSITNETDTFRMKIYGNTDIVRNGLPPNYFNVVGIVEQEDLVRPYNSGYSIAPRSYSDFEVLVSLPQNALYRNLNIYPNPSNGVFNLSIQSGDEDILVHVYDQTGKLILERYGNGENERFDLNKAQPGLYFVHVLVKKETVEVLPLAIIR